jgi:hypothetical protein
LGLDDGLGRERRRSEVAHLALPHEIGQRRQRVVEIGVRVRTVHLVEVDVVGAQPAEAVLDGPDDPPAGVALLVGVLAHGPVELGGEHYVVAPTGEGLPDDLLGLTGRVDVRGVDEVDAGIEGPVDDADALLAGTIADAAEHHGAEAQRADLDPGGAERAIAHGVSFERRSEPSRPVL